MADTPAASKGWGCDMEGNRNGTLCNYYGLVIRSSGITRFKFHLSHSDLHSNTKKCPNVPPEVKQEMRQLLDQKNKLTL